MSKYKSKLILCTLPQLHLYSIPNFTSRLLICYTVGMDLEKEIDKVLFEMVKDIKLYRVDVDNTVIDVEYQKYTAQILRVFMNYLAEE